LIPPFLLFLPLVAWELFHLRWPAARLAWLAPLIVAFARLNFEPLPEAGFGASASTIGSSTTTDGMVSQMTVLAAVLVCTAACLLAWRSAKAEHSLASYRLHRDDLTATQRSLELRNQGLHERQVLELRLATLNERSRIAREIHDNVGHLLTRSVLQVEALQVVHADDRQLADELTQVGETLHTAFETLRSSVHGLHSEANDLHSQLRLLATNSKSLDVSVECTAEQVPPQIAYTFLAIVREALSNTERHSDANSVQVTVVDFPGLWQLIVHDNGSVQPKAEQLKSGGLGLISMEERVRSFGGAFRTSYDHGFRVFVSIPRKQQDNDSSV
jgi:signal transduction histidine kinase